MIDPTRKALKDGVLPSLNLPKKSISVPSYSSRDTTSIKKREESSSQINPSSIGTNAVYKSFPEFQQRISKLKLGNSWSIDFSESLVTISSHTDNYLLSKFEIFVDSSLQFTLRVFGWLLTDDHDLYMKYERSFINVTLSNFIQEIEQSFLCKGIDIPDVKAAALIQRHVIPKKFSFAKFQQSSSQTRFFQDEFLRSGNCPLLLSGKNQCSSCLAHGANFIYESKRKEVRLKEPAKLTAPVSFTSPERLKLTLQQHRLKCKQLEQQINEMRQSLENESKEVDPQLHQDFLSLFSSCEEKNVPPFMKLFWDEQQKYNKESKSSSIRYHPMVIKFCLSLATKSPSTYADLRYNKKTGSGVLVLPSLRTLRDYKNYIHPKRGFNPDVIKDLSEKTKPFSPAERYVTILFDEMKIQEDLVWNKHTGELIGFVDLGDIDTNYATLKDVQQLATHVLVFLVKSIVNPLSFSLATFATTGATSYQIFPIFWKAVNILENIDLKVIAATADGASSNRKFFRMHKALDGDCSENVVYRTQNLFSKEERFIYFFADVPHLMKTARNCLANSGSGRTSRLLWNDGFHILWSHISKFYFDDLDSGLKMLPKLTSDHFNLTPYSVMRVHLAAQVLSDTVAVCLDKFGPPEASATAKFCSMMDKFFDCLNVRNTTEHVFKRKPFSMPYSDIDDPRFTWLDQFLDYFSQWKESIERRQGEFSANAKSNMFISWQTYEGLQTSVLSFKEVCRFLLQNGVPYVLSNRFCQDDLENYFGRQRAIDSRRDNPSVRDVGYNDNTIKSQFSVRPIAGNVNVEVGKYDVSNTEPLPKRSKDKK